MTADQLREENNKAAIENARQRPMGALLVVGVGLAVLVVSFLGLISDIVKVAQTLKGMDCLPASIVLSVSILTLGSLIGIGLHAVSRIGRN